MRTFVLNDDKSSKFWNIEQTGNSFTVTYGKAGSKGRSTTKTFDDTAEATTEHDKLIAEKLRKGYVETTASSASTSSPLLTALEQALVENPDDLASHSARADYLIDQGDPRGEFAQVQLALEDPNQTAEARKKLRKRETELLRRHLQEWLGDFGRFMLDGWWNNGGPLYFQFARGWLDALRLHPYPGAMISSMAKSPAVQLLRRLDIVFDMRFYPFELFPMVEQMAEVMTEEELEGFEPSECWEEVEIMEPLLASPYLTNLRAFELGYHNMENGPEPLRHTTQIISFDYCTGEHILQFLEKNPKMEELHINTHVGDARKVFGSPLLKNLRVFQYHFGMGTWNDRESVAAYPLSDLANNVHLKNLTTLRLHPGRDATIVLSEMEALLRSPNLPSLTDLQIHMTAFGDEGVEPILDSGILKRLRVLDIGYGNLTDEGARRLAACPDLKNLDRLDVSYNALTQKGINALKATGVEIVASNQHGADEDEYLYEVDIE